MTRKGLIQLRFQVVHLPSPELLFVAGAVAMMVDGCHAIMPCPGVVNVMSMVAATCCGASCHYYDKDVDDPYGHDNDDEDVIAPACFVVPCCNFPCG